MIRRPPRSPLFPSTPLSRSAVGEPAHAVVAVAERRQCAHDVACLPPLEQAPERVVVGDVEVAVLDGARGDCVDEARAIEEDRKSTRLNSSHSQISYAVFCLK